MLCLAEDEQGALWAGTKSQGLFRRVGSAWQGRPVLDAQQVEDVVAYLATLTDP